MRRRTTFFAYLIIEITHFQLSSFSDKFFFPLEIGRAEQGLVQSLIGRASEDPVLVARRSPRARLSVHHEESFARVSLAAQGLPLRDRQLLRASRTFPCPCSRARARAHRSRENLCDYVCVNGRQTGSRACSRAVGVPRVAYDRLQLGSTPREAQRGRQPLRHDRDREPSDDGAGKRARAALYLY